MFENIIPACEGIQKIIITVFENNAEMIMSQFVQSVFEKKVQVCLLLVCLRRCLTKIKPAKTYQTLQYRVGQKKVPTFENS